MIYARNLSFAYPDSQSRALADLDLRLEAGGLCCLLGANGSGKSTLLQVLAGLLQPEGDLKFGEQPGSAPSRRLLPQNPEIYILGATVEEDLLLGLNPKDPQSRDKALELLERFALADKRESPVHFLSFGQKRKLCLASALAAEPELLLLDEPFAGLDFASALFVRETLAANRDAGLTQILSTHDLDLVADLADCFIVLKDGRILAQGSGADVSPYLEPAGVRPPCQWRLGSSAPLWLPV